LEIKNEKNKKLEKKEIRKRNSLEIKNEKNKEKNKE